MNHKTHILLSAGFCALIFAGSNAAATVFSIEGSGEYRIDEVKDFRQRDETNPATGEITPVAPAGDIANPDDITTPVIARVVTPQPALDAIETETALPPQTELAPQTELNPADFTVALPVDVEIFEPDSANIFDPTVAGAVPGNNDPSQTQAAAKLPVSGPLDTAALLSSFVKDYSGRPFAPDDLMTPAKLVVAAASARTAADDAPQTNLAASVIPDEYKSLIAGEDSSGPIIATPVTTAPQVGSSAIGPALSSRTDTKPHAAIVAVIAKDYPALDTALIHAVIEVESHYNAQALSKKGAMGLMQLMPKTAKFHKVVDVFDPLENIRGGAAELNLLMEKYDNVGLALAAYNAGQAAVDKHDGIPPYKETREYVVKVLSKTFDNRKRATKLPQVNPTETVETAEIEPKEKPRKMMVYSFDW